MRGDGSDPRGPLAEAPEVDRPDEAGLPPGLDKAHAEARSALLGALLGGGGILAVLQIDGPLWPGIPADGPLGYVLAAGVALLALSLLAAGVQLVRVYRDGRRAGHEPATVLGAMLRPARRRAESAEGRAPPDRSRAEGPRRSGMPAEPREAARIIRDMAADLEGDDRGVVEAAAGAAQRIVDLLATLDAEIASLAQDDPEHEVRRLEERLAGVAAHEEDVARLVRSQLRPARRLAERLEALTGRRVRLVELLRTVWLHVVDLRSRAADDALFESDITGRVLAVCEEVERQVAASRQVAGLLGPSPDEDFRTARDTGDRA